MAGCGISLKTITGLNPNEAEYQAYLGWAMFNGNPDKAEECREVIRVGLKLNKELAVAWRFGPHKPFNRGRRNGPSRTFRGAE